MKTWTPKAAGPELNHQTSDAAEPVRMVGLGYNPDFYDRAKQALQRAEARTIRRQRQGMASADQGGEAHQTNEAVQRKTGFEVELDVPAYIEPPAARKPVLVPPEELQPEEERDIQSFLGGGLEYSYTYGIQDKGYFSLTADHASFQTQHAALIQALTEAELIQPFFYRSMTNLEYVTPAFEETTEDLIDAAADAIRVHAADTAQKGAANSRQGITAPAHELFTGIPLAALRKLVGENAQLRGLVDALPQGFTKEVYFQQSSGFHPSEIPALFTGSATEMLNQQKHQMALAALNLQPGQYNDNRQQVDERIGQINDEAVGAAKPKIYAKAKLLSGAVETAAGVVFPETVPGAKKEPIKGYLTLMAQYLIASKLEGYADFSSGTEKNMVSFLLRTRLEQARDALPEGTTEHLATTWEASKVAFKNTATQKSTAIAQALNWQNPAAAKHVLGEDPDASLEAAIAGNQATSVLPGSLIDIEKAQFEGDVTTGEKLVVLEDRDLAYKMPKVSKVPAAVALVLKGRWKKMVRTRAPILNEEYRENLGLWDDQDKELSRLLAMLTYYGVDAELLRLNLEIWSQIMATPALVAMLEAVGNVNELIQQVTEAEEDQKLGLLKQGLIHWADAKLTEAIGQKRDIANESREEVHQTVDKEIGDVECQVTNAENWEPMIREVEDHYVITFKGKLKVLQDFEGFAAFAGDNGGRLVQKCEGGQLKKLRFNSLQQEEYVWENV